MNQVAVREPQKAQLVTGGDVAAIVPRTLEETFRLAGALHASGMVPNTLNSPEKVMVAIIAGAELGMPPFQALQSFAVINGRPAIWGDGLIAVVRSHGMKVKEWIEGSGDQMTAHCIVTRPSGEEIERTFSVGDAKTAKLWGKQGPWQSNPSRMLQMRARGFACRDGAADVLRGFQLREEVEDYDGPIRNVTDHATAHSTGTGMRERLEARSGVGGFDPEHVSQALDDTLDGDDIPAVFDDMPVRDDTPPADDTHLDGEPEPAFTEAETPPATVDLADATFDPLDWAASFTRGLDGLSTAADVEAAWKQAKTNGFVVKLKAANPQMADALVDAVNARVRELAGG